ncbi:transmembrane channel-like protein 8 isoform X2 [Dendropsophus ebraccatus]|uniref:transmembrane channel-like protein 8 isoform X2 n=1 Tax=Dendropsophus ebraccatus TaxID=150705 RepID=UPI00383130D4
MDEFKAKTWNSGDKNRITKVKYNNLRDNPVPMEEKRRLRGIMQSEGYNVGFWNPWTQKHHVYFWPSCPKGERVLLTFKLWEKSLIDIRVRFGSSVSSYFLFLRFLLLLNFASLILTTGLIILPIVFLNKTERNHSFIGCGNASTNQSQSLQSPLLDVFTGEGFMKDTFLFYGHYTDVKEKDDTFSVRLSYLLTPFIFLLICSLGLLRCTVKGITQRRVCHRHYGTSISSKVFSGWDFCVRGTVTSTLKQKSFSDDIKRSSDPFLSLVTQYLVPIVISLVLLILPYFFMFMVKFEGLSPSAEITSTLIRCVILRLGILTMVLFSLGQKILCLGGSKTSCENCGYNTQFQCWETSVGQEFYKLSIYHFLQLVVEFFFLQMPRSFLFSRYQCRLVRWLGKEKFCLSQNVLNTVYGQTVVWGGMFYSPLLPLLNLIFLFITYYIKKYSLYHLCDVSPKLFRESTLKILFHFVLFLGLMKVFFPLSYLLTSARPSHTCGLFTDYNTPWEAVQNSTRSALPPVALTVLSYLTSDIVAYSLLLILCLVLTCYVSRVRQNELDLEHLKDLLSNQIKDKEFLVRRLRKEQNIQSQVVDH